MARRGFNKLTEGGSVTGGSNVALLRFWDQANQWPEATIKVLWDPGPSKGVKTLLALSAEEMEGGTLISQRSELSVVSKKGGCEEMTPVVSFGGEGFSKARILLRRLTAVTELQRCQDVVLAK